MQCQRQGQLSADWLRIRDGSYSWMGLAPEQAPRCRQNIFCARKHICLCDEKSSANVFKSGKGHSGDHFRTALKIATLSALCRCCLHSKWIGYEGLGGDDEHICKDTFPRPLFVFLFFVFWVMRAGVRMVTILAITGLMMIWQHQVILKKTKLRKSRLSQEAPAALSSET